MNVRAIATGTVAIKRRQLRGRGKGPLRLVRTLIDREWTNRLPIHAWLIDHADGLIVVDTGETARIDELGYLPRRHPYYRFGLKEWVEPEDEIGPQLQALGVEARDVSQVILTHLHNDHAGGLSHFRDSEILVHRTEYDEARGWLGRVRGFLPQHWPEWFAPRLFDLDDDAYGPFPRSLRVTDAGDVTIVPTHGHTRGHVSVAVEADDHILFLAGDASYTEQLMTERAIDGIAPDPEAARQTLERIGELARQRPVVYLPSHDPDASGRLERRQPVVP